MTALFEDRFPDRMVFTAGAFVRNSRTHRLADTFVSMLLGNAG
jgi:hypothetical protein